MTKKFILKSDGIVYVDGQPMKSGHKARLYAAYANRGLSEAQLKNPDIAWSAGGVDPDEFERVFMQINTSCPFPEGYRVSSSGSLIKLQS